MTSFFTKLFYLVNKNKWLTILLALLMLAVCGFFASKITFEEDITKVIPKSQQGDITTKVVQQLKFSDKITVLIAKSENGTVDDLTQTAAAFLDELKCCADYIKNVQGKVDDSNIQQTFDFVYNHLPLFLETEEYEKIENRLAKDSIALLVENNLKTLISPTGIVAKDFIVADPMGISFMALEKLQRLNVSDNFSLVNGYIVTEDEQSLLLFIDPILPGSETEKNTDFIAHLKQVQNKINTEFSGKTNLNYFGSSFIAVANAQQIKTDIFTTVLVSMGVLMLLLILYYRKVYVPIIIFIPSVFGGLFALMCMYFLKDSISAISISIGAVLLGITIDYALHILTYYRNNSGVDQLFKGIVKPLIMSSTTTAVAFLCLLFVNSEALQDLGLFASITVVMSAVFSIVIIPHLYRPKNVDGITRKSILDKLATYSFEKNKVLIYGSILLIGLSFFTYQKVTFDDDLSKLNFIPEEIKAVEKQLENSTNLTSKSLYLVLYGEEKEAVLQKNVQLKKQLEKYMQNQDILDFSSLSGIVLSQEEQQQRIEQWNNFWANGKKDKLEQNLIESGEEIGFKPETHQRFYQLLDQNPQKVTVDEYAEIPAFFADEFISEKDGLFTITTVVKVDDENRSAFVKSITDTENKLIVIDRKQLNETFLGHLKDDFNRLINYSFVAVIFILLYFFRRLELVMISLVPITITGFITMGLMGLFDIQLNIFSTIVTTLIFGHGIDFTIFMTTALQKEHSYGKSELTTYRTSILLAVLTTILAIGALIFAEHPALKSISTLSLIGVFSALLITFVFYPIVFKICVTNRVRNHKSPISLRLFLHSVISFLYYGLGSVFLSLLGRCYVLFPIGNKEKKIRSLRKFMSKFLTSVLYSNPFVKKEILNPNGETFQKPAVIISNHTSFLDSLTLSMVSPKIIFLVNDWVYNSPVFGKFVRMAGFYPVSQGVDGSVEHLREKIEQGYSLMVFPEGTRSDTNHINRFHKGAFYLAEQFNLDVLPVYVHGNSETLPKDDYIIYDGSITVKIGERIAPNHPDFGVKYSERTKKISRYFKAEFTSLRKQIEDENYFEKKLYWTYLYKDLDIVRAVKADFKQRKSIYHSFFELMDSQAKIYHIADDFGQIDLLLSWQFPLRKITTYIKDEDKREAAKVNYPVGKRNIVYENSLNLPDDTSTLLISTEITQIITVPDVVKKIFFLGDAKLSSVKNLNEFTEFVNQKGLIGYSRNE